MAKMAFRKEKDSLGIVEVPSDKYWAAQTQRSTENFRIGGEKIPIEVIRAYAILKKSAALANADLGVLTKKKAQLIGRVCNEFLKGELRDSKTVAVASVPGILLPDVGAAFQFRSNESFVDSAKVVIRKILSASVESSVH